MVKPNITGKSSKVVSESLTGPCALFRPCHHWCSENERGCLTIPVSINLLHHEGKIVSAVTLHSYGCRVLPFSWSQTQARVAKSMEVFVLRCRLHSFVRFECQSFHHSFSFLICFDHHPFFLSFYERFSVNVQSLKVSLWYLVWLLPLFFQLWKYRYRIPWPSQGTAG